MGPGGRAGRICGRGATGTLSRQEMTASVLIVGCGSIGQRHARNLRSLGVGEICVYDPDGSRAEQAVRDAGAVAVGSVEAGLALRPQAVFICTPPHLHTAGARAAVDAGAHVFIEKPLSDRLDDVAEMIGAAARRKLVVMAGYNLRFHAGLLKLKELVKTGSVGRVLTVRAEYGQYLPTWRPGRDYRQGYIARPETGGGIILEESHELDYVAWLGGRVESVYAAAGKLSDLEIVAEDVALMVLRLEGGALGEVHVDCVQREYRREAHVVGTEGTATWVYEKGVRLARASREPEFFDIVPDPNQMYLDEVRCFLNCIAGNAQPPVDGASALQDLRVALAAKESARICREVAVG